MQYKCLNGLSMLYLTVKLITVVLIYKIVSLGPYSASASTLVMPLWFVMGDVVAEVYGYRVARQTIWTAIVCQFIFAFTCAWMTSFSSPLGWEHQDAYSQVLGKLPRVAFASFLAIFCGAFVNAYAISRWKVLLKGKYFWLRSLGASAVGELVFTVVAYMTEFLGVVSIDKLFQLMLISYLVKLLLNPLLVIPSAVLAYVLKRIEGLDVYDVNARFNPFQISLNENSSLKRTVGYLSG